ncbi:MAG: peptidoglycan DD-metalloendopeptidase family protein [Acidimicrobiia bacterium]|nr:peptidoglycan DD-metalloendopeptidase family protein [Acidimicrobiia bacterium]MDH3396916.1 peptidoglycan DD-metalloendopeptidase family protein [Acidimicrobiia bacterium]
MRRLAPLVLIGALFVVTAVPGSAQSSEERLGEIEQAIKDLNARIAAEQGERAGIQLELAEAEERMLDVRLLLADAEERLTEVETSISTTEQVLADIGRQIADLKRQLADIRLEVRDTRSLVRERAVELYMEGGAALSSLVFTTADVSEVELGLHYAEEVIADSEGLINSLEVLRYQEEQHQEAVEVRQAEAEDLLAGLEAKRGELVQYQAEVETRRQEVAAELENATALLARANRDIDEFEGEISALEKESEQIAAELAAKQATGGESPGIIGWPVNASVGSGFGYRVHPIFRTKKLHTGLDLNAAAGAPIMAAESGTVILARTYGGYGRAVVIDHGGGLSTLYAHQSSMLVSEGQRVERGDVIGYVGCTGYCTGPHLHFETREWGTPVDPMKYLS